MNVSPFPAPLATVLVATDFSRGAQRAVSRALQLPLAPAAKIHLLHVTAETVYDAPRRQALAAANLAMKEALAAARAAGHGGGFSVTGKVVTGKPHEELIRHARLLGAELLVIGRHGRRRLRDVFMGSTAERVMRYGDVPVLLVGASVRGPYRRPVAAVDFGETTRRTLETLLRVVGPGTVEVPLINARPTPIDDPVSTAYSIANEGAHRKFARQQAMQAANEVLAALPDWGVAWPRVFAWGDPRGVALGKARALGADLIAIGTHGRAGVSHLLLGSVAERVAAAAHCDVLVARPVRFTFEPVV